MHKYMHFKLTSNKENTTHISCMRHGQLMNYCRQQFFFRVVVVQFGLFLLSMHSKQLFVPYSIATFSAILVVVGILAINRVRMWQKR